MRWHKDRLVDISIYCGWFQTQSPWMVEACWHSARVSLSPEPCRSLFSSFFRRRSWVSLRSLRRCFCRRVFEVHFQDMQLICTNIGNYMYRGRRGFSQSRTTGPSFLWPSQAWGPGSWHRTHKWQHALNPSWIPRSLSSYLVIFPTEDIQVIIVY